jgi:NitT/TauT family transport system substrate-binding protein
MRRFWRMVTIALMVSGPAAAGAQTPAPLRVATTTSDTYAEAYYAQEKGFFQRAGLGVEVSTFNNGSALAAAVASGAVDFGVSTPIGLAQAVSRGVPFVIVAAGALNTAKEPAGLIVVAKNSTIRDAKDLEGKPFAINALKTGSELVLDAWLGQNGADIAKVHTVEMPFSEMAAALQRGTVAGALMTEPALSQSLNTTVRPLANANLAIAPQYLLSAWFSTETFVRNNPDVVRRFAAAIYEAGRWANRNHNESAVILAEHAKLGADVTRMMMRVTYTDAVRLPEIQSQLDLGAKYGILTRPMVATELLPR